MDEKKLCCRCVLPEVPGHISLDEKGVCSICQKHSTKELDKIGFYSFDSEKKKTILVNKIRKRKGNGKYDCVVAVSGGKDSIMALYIARRILGLNPLAVFVDNGFSIKEMYENIQNAVDVLAVDLLIYRTTEIKNIFRILLLSKKEVYYCRVCHLLLDKYIKDICNQYGISLILGGYTKGQSYISQEELFWIYEVSDKNVVQILGEHPEYKELIDMFRNPVSYFGKNYKNMEQISPYKYMDYNEKDMLKLLKQELNFKVPEYSWPHNSTNCTFNFLSQYLARRQFGYSQHETEMSGLVRNHEMEREEALRVLQSPITDADICAVLQKIGLAKAEIGIE